MRFGDYQDELKAQFGNTSPDATTTALIKRAINEAYEKVVTTTPEAYWFRKHWSFTTLARVSSTTGVDPVTGGNRAVGIDSSSRVTREMIGAVIRINEEEETYVIWDVSSSSALVLDRPFTGADVGTALSGVDLEIVGWNYIMPPDFISAYSVTISNNPLYLYAGNQRLFDRITPDPVILGQRGTPYYYYEGPGYDFPDFWGTDAVAQFQSGRVTVDVTNNSRTVGQGATDPEFDNSALLADDAGDPTTHNLLPGHFFKTAAQDRFYRILEVTQNGSDFELSLDVPYQGTTASDVEFQIDDGHAPIMRLYPLPDTAQQVEVNYHAKPPDLILDDDEPRIPRNLHNVIRDGAMYYFAQYQGDEDRRRQYRDDFDRGLLLVRKNAEPTAATRFRFQEIPELTRAGNRIRTAGIFPQEIEVS